MAIIGFNCYGHDSAVSLLVDGIPRACVSEERFTRSKLTGVFPARAMAYCLSEAHRRTEKIECFVYFYHPAVAAYRKAWYLLRGLPANRKEWEFEAVALLKIARLEKKLQQARGARSPGEKVRLRFVEHHLAHAASAFYLSGFAEAAILSLDGIGEWCTSLCARGADTTITPLQRIYFPHSLGLLYAAVTDYLGFSPLSDEYKVMGLASYGKPVFAKEFSRIVSFGNKKSFKIDHRYLRLNFEHCKDNFVSERFLRLFGPGRRPEEPALGRYADIAASLQQVLEEVVLQMARRLYELTRSDNLCLAGGVALNCAMNGRLLREGPFKRIFVQPAANDSGTSLGAALYLYHQLLGNPRKYVMADAYLGPAYSDEEIEQMLKENRLRFRRCEKIEAEVARLLAEGRVVGWFQGRMEFGPRALGNRSILADARRAEMKDLVNERIKHREMFRPFAPSVRIEDAGEYFVGCVESPFMTMVYPVRRDKQGVIPAVTHVDGTARVQTVDRKSNPRYWELLRCFKELTGVGVVLNTSFNVKGEPIVCTPEDALKCFYSTGLEYLAIGTYLVEK